MSDATRSAGERTRAVYVISVAAELAGVHPQTLRIYERKGLVDPAAHHRRQPALQRGRHRTAPADPGAHQRRAQPGRRPAGPRARERGGAAAGRPRQAPQTGDRGRGRRPPPAQARAGAAASGGRGDRHGPQGLTPRGGCTSAQLVLAGQVELLGQLLGVLVGQPDHPGDRVDVVKGEIGVDRQRDDAATDGFGRRQEREFGSSR